METNILELEIQLSVLFLYLKILKLRFFDDIDWLVDVSRGINLIIQKVDEFVVVFSTSMNQNNMWSFRLLFIKESVVVLQLDGYSLVGFSLAVPDAFDNRIYLLHEIKRFHIEFASIDLANEHFLSGNNEQTLFELVLFKEMHSLAIDTHWLTQKW